MLIDPPHRQRTDSGVAEQWKQPDYPRGCTSARARSFYRRSRWVSRIQTCLMAPKQLAAAGAGRRTRCGRQYGRAWEPYAPARRSKGAGAPILETVACAAPVDRPSWVRPLRRSSGCNASAIASMRPRRVRPSDVRSEPSARKRAAWPLLVPQLMRCT